MGFGFWIKCVGVILLGALACLVVFLLLDIAWAAWGGFGALVAIAAVLLLVAWLYDRRNARPDY
jgi:hypothetical protein